MREAEPVPSSFLQHFCHLHIGTRPFSLLGRSQSFMQLVRLSTTDVSHTACSATLSSSQHTFSKPLLGVFQSIITAINTWGPLKRSQPPTRSSASRTCRHSVVSTNTHWLGRKQSGKTLFILQTTTQKLYILLNLVNYFQNNLANCSLFYTLKLLFAEAFFYTHKDTAKVMSSQQ